jgi:hypothetical protein
VTDKLLVTLPSNKIEIIPGKKSEIKAIIKNASDVAESYSISVDGIDPRWYTLSAASVSLSPGDTSELTLTIQPPLISSGEAERYTANLKVTSTRDSSITTTVSIEMPVGSLLDFYLELTPKKQTGRKGSFVVTITNKGDKPATYAIEGKDSYNVCRFQFKQQTIDAQPGETVKVSLSVEPKEKPFRGSVEAYKFKVVVTPHGSLPYQSKRVGGELTYKPVLRTVPAFLFVLAVFIVVIAINGLSPTVSNLIKGDLPITYTLNMNMDGYGTLNGYGTYDEGTVASIRASAAPKWEFVEWTGDIDTISDRLSSSTTVVMDGDCNITANFSLTEATPYTVYNIVFNPQFTSDPRAAIVMVFSHWVTIEFDFAVDFDFENTASSNVDILTDVHIVALPFSNGALTSEREVRGCNLLWPQDKKGEIGFAIHGRRVIVDHVKFQVKSADKRIILHEFFIPVNYRFGQDF